MKIIIKTILCTSLGLFATLALAQAEQGEDSIENQSNKEDVWTPPKLKSFSKSKIRKECKKYEGKYIGYYSKVYYVKSCKRHEIKSQKRVEKLSLSHNVVSVEGSTIIMIKKGEPYEEKQAKRSCKRFNKRYIMNQNGDVYWVQNCKRHAFPDWESYITHRKKKKLKSSDIIELTDSEFNSLKVGKTQKSILDEAYKNLYSEDDTVDEIIPVDEACEGINNRYISYYSKIYKVVKCYKREVNPETFLVKFKNYKLKEVTSTVWLSLPTGKPYKL